MKQPSKKNPRIPQEHLTWCFGYHSRRDPICFDCPIRESCFITKEG